VTADTGRPLRVAVLGPVRAWRGDAELDLGAPQRRAVLALLAVRANQVVSRDELIDGIWGDDLPAGPVNALHVQVSRLRAALEPTRALRAPGTVLLASGAGYQLLLAPGQLDAELFAARLADARAARASGDPVAAGSFAAALELWQGSALAGIAGPLAQTVRVGLGEQRLAATEEHIDTLLALGRHANAAERLIQLVREHPLRERFTEQLMLALYRCGRQAEALAVFAGARRVLTGELGIEPGPPLRQLHARILGADPGLDLATPARTPAAPARPVPAQLPADVAAFTGRTAELAELDLQLAAAGGRPSAVVVSVVSGTAGVGKTGLAVRWARRVMGSFPDGQLYVNLRGYDPGQPAEPGEALAGFLRALGMAGRDIPPGTEERAAAYRSQLDGRRVLVILDNAASAEQVRPLLPGSPACLVVVTSRDSLAGLVARHGARRLDLDMLPLPDAVGLLRTLIGDRVDAEPAAAAALAGQCARLPLALRVAAELAAASPGTPLAALTGELASEQRRLDLLDAGGDERTAVRGVFSWSYRHLPPAAARAFRLAGLHPGPDLDAYALAALAPAADDRSAAAAADLLTLLARAHLIRPASAGRYSMHDLLRAYARQLAAGSGDEAGGATLTRLFDYYLATAATAMDVLVPAERHYRPSVPAAGTPVPAVTSTARARAWLDAERATLVAIAGCPGSPGYAVRLAAVLFRYLETGGHYADAVTVHTRARQAARLAGDRAAEATALTNLGIICWRQGRYQQAAGYHEQALASSAAIGDRAGEAIAVANLGAVYERQGLYDQAAESHRRALGLFREAGDRSGEARALANLGSVAGRQGRHEQAVGWYQRALALFRELGDRTGEASALPDVGLAYQRQGRYDEAAACYRRALRLFGETGDRIGEAEARNGVAEVLLATGQPEQARDEAAAALLLAGQIGDLYEQARAHTGLSAALHATGERGLAGRHRQRARELAAELGAAETPGPAASETPGPAASETAGPAAEAPGAVAPADADEAPMAGDLDALPLSAGEMSVW
jgi:DNA-binding SARP family transcriptional activator/tetratricopeptide (TPR) repeat protein